MVSLVGARKSVKGVVLDGGGRHGAAPAIRDDRRGIHGCVAAGLEMLMVRFGPPEVAAALWSEDMIKSGYMAGNP